MIRTFFPLSLIGLVAHIAPAFGQSMFDRTVASAVEAQAVARRATAGGIIRLAPGDYDAMDFSHLRPAAPLRIVAADAANPPRLGRLTVNDSDNLSFERLVFVPRPSSLEARFGFVANITRSSKIDLKYLTFAGSDDAKAALARALGVTDSRDVSLTDSDLADFDRGGVFSRSQSLTVEHNHIKGMAVDGFNFAEVEDVRIIGNYFESFQTGKAHPDYVQFWTNRTTNPSRDILIAENLFARGGGNVVQGIFMGNEFKIRYVNVTIRDNVLFQESPHGIAVYMADNIIVENNVVLAVPSSHYKVALRLIDSNGVARNNIATALDLGTFTGIQQTNQTVPLSDTTRLTDAERTMTAVLTERDSGSFTLAGHSVSAALRRVGPR